MELRHLRYFVAVAEELSFRRAAERLAMAQPPLSQQIADLEREVGAALFDRSRRQVRLTPAGQVLLADARETLAQLERAAARVRRAGRGETGQLTIGYTSLISCPLFPPALQLYRARYPEVDIVLRDLVTIEQMESLQASALDVSFATYASLALTRGEEKRLAHEAILRQPLALVVARHHHRAAAPGEPVPLSALAQEPWIWFARRYDPTTYDHMMRLFAQAGFRPRIVQEVNQLLVYLGLVAAGLGVSLLPAATAPMAGEGVAYLPLAKPVPLVEFDVVWRRDDPSPLVEGFLDAVRETARHAAALA
jgi:DNA-binding transcriptional LysR family regulator